MSIEETLSALVHQRMNKLVDAICVKVSGDTSDAMNSEQSKTRIMATLSNMIPGYDDVSGFGLELSHNPMDGTAMLSVVCVVNIDPDDQIKTLASMVYEDEQPTCH